MTALGIDVMLQHNANASRHAHVTHATVVALHTLCCGLPALAMTVAALAGATSGVTLLSESVAEIHHFLHAHELWILALSAALVLGGGWLEARARGRGHAHGVPWLFLFSVFCFAVNAAVIAIHRG